MKSLKPTLKEQLQNVEERLNKALHHEEWQSREITSLRNSLTEFKRLLDESNKDKQWLKQLCQEQSSSIAGYMRSR